MKFNCPHCETRIEIEDSDLEQFRGQEIQCPTCEGQIQMDFPEPEVEPVVEQEVAEDLPAEPDPAPPAESKPKKPRTVYKKAAPPADEPDSEPAPSQNKGVRNKRMVKGATGSSPSIESLHQPKHDVMPEPKKRSPLPFVIAGIVLLVAGVGLGIAIRGKPPVATAKTSAEQTMETQEVEKPSEPDTPAVMNERAVELSNQGQSKAAFELFKKAAQQGHMGAAGNLGVCYFKAAGTTQNDDMSIQWLSKAKSTGTLIAIADQLSNGGQLRRAFTYWMAAANLGDAVAQHKVGAFYMGGLGVSKDAAKAVAWYRKAAENGLAASQLQLGLAYYTGEGTLEKDVDTAMIWLKRSSAQGNTDAAEIIKDIVDAALVERGMKKSPPDEDAARELLKRSSDAKIQQMIDTGQLIKATRTGIAFEFLKSDTTDARATVNYEFHFYTKSGLQRKYNGYLFWYHHPKELMWYNTIVNIDGVPPTVDFPVNFQ